MKSSLTLIIDVGNWLLHSILTYLNFSLAFDWLRFSLSIHLAVISLIIWNGLWSTFHVCDPCRKGPSRQRCIRACFQTRNPHSMCCMHSTNLIWMCVPLIWTWTPDGKWVRQFRCHSKIKKNQWLQFARNAPKSEQNSNEKRKDIIQIFFVSSIKCGTCIVWMGLVRFLNCIVQQHEHNVNNLCRSVFVPSLRIHGWCSWPFVCLFFRSFSECNRMHFGCTQRWINVQVFKIVECISNIK